MKASSRKCQNILPIECLLHKPPKNLSNVSTTSPLDPLSGIVPFRTPTVGPAVVPKSIAVFVLRLCLAELLTEKYQLNGDTESAWFLRDRGLFCWESQVSSPAERPYIAQQSQVLPPNFLFPSPSLGARPTSQTNGFPPASLTGTPHTDLLHIPFHPRAFF